MSNVSSCWARSPLELQRRFQSLVFPEGIVYEFGEGFRTAQIGESYQLIRKIADESTINSSLVDSTSIFWNQVYEQFSTWYGGFSTSVIGQRLVTTSPA